MSFRDGVSKSKCTTCLVLLFNLYKNICFFYCKIVSIKTTKMVKFNIT